MKSACLAALLLAALTPFIPLQALAASASAAPLPPEAGEVIVGFKPEALSLRKHALAARAEPAAVKAALARRAEDPGTRLARTLHSGPAVGERAQVMRAPGLDAATLARLLQSDPDVAYAVPNGRKRIVAAPNDPLYAAAPFRVRPNGPDSGQWYLRAPDATVRAAIDIEGAWARTTGSSKVVVAVLDTGVRFEHPDLKSRLLPGYDTVSDVVVANDGDGRDADPSDPGDWITAADKRTSKFSDCDVSDSSWHGTSTASLVGATANSTPATGMAGSAPGVRVLPVRVLGKCFGNDSDILAGMRWAAGIPVDGLPANPNPAKVINLSLGGAGACKPNYQAAVDEITARGVTIVAAAGNSAGGAVNEPANCRGVVGVLALRHVGTKVGFSDLGPEISIAAPGGNCVNVTQGSPCLYPILAATNAGTEGPGASGWTDSVNTTLGTSFSSPLVAGVAALMVSRQPALTPAQLRNAMQATARPFPTTGGDNGAGEPPVAQCVAPASGVTQFQCYCTTALCGAGMLDASAAVAAVATAPFVTVSLTPASPVVGDTVSFNVTGLQTPNGGSVPTYTWSLSAGNGVASDFSTGNNADTIALTAGAVGTVLVSLTVTDPQGGIVSTDQAVTVRAAPVTQPAPDSDSGGGASSGAWVAGVALAAALLRRLRPAAGLKAARRRA